MNQSISKKQNKSHIPGRLNFLFFVTFLCFAALFVRLAYIQLYSGERFSNMVQRTESTLSTGTVPRGMIYDSFGKVLVGNRPEQAILYTRNSDSVVSPNDLVDIATQLASLIVVPNTHLTERDLKDYFIVKNTKTVNDRLSKEEKQLKGTDLYQAQLDKVTSEDIQFSNAEEKIAALFRQMNAAYAFSTVPVKNQNVTPEEIARVSEQLGNLPGISIGTDWQRIYPQEDMLTSILGQVSSERRGIPSEVAGEYLLRGYAMNDRVGISYLEQQYEDSLRGTKSLYNFVTDSSDSIIKSEQLFEGTKGDNIVMTINSDFQKRIDDILENALRDMPQQGLNDRAYVVAMNPKNGDILGISGKRYEYDANADNYNKDEIIDDTLGAINSNFGMGSSVKPAMDLIGYMENVISIDNNQIIDEPLKFQASQWKSSVFNRPEQNEKIELDEITALQKSSNIYMIKLAMRIGGQYTYEEEGPLSIVPETLEKIRQYFALFGLGVETGIDLPNESAGFLPESDQLVNAIDLSYGQFDLYTPLQMAQYVSTIANGGIRYAPRLVKEIRGTDADGNLGDVKSTIEPKVMNIIPVSPEQMARIHEGMRQVSHADEGTARYLFKNYPITVGSKTGTTEAFYSGPIQYAQNQPVTNATFIGFAPYDDPEIAISVVVPFLEEENWGRISTQIAREVMNAYFELKAETKQLIEDYMNSPASSTVD